MEKHNIDKLNKMLTKEFKLSQDPDFGKVLNKFFSDKIADIWTVEDVIERGKEYNVTFSNKQAKKILDEILRDHDANVGINWEVIDLKIGNFLADKIIITVDKINDKIKHPRNVCA